ncbi:MAG TPA: ATP-binding protein [Steroidobacteraceae bacterium]|nr:ATP-binding protein [Steroidobacteraceae bacterium]
MVLQRRREQRRLLIEEESQVGEARRDAQRLAMAYGLDATQTGRVAIAATELATNLYRHGSGGEMLLQPLRSGDKESIELLAIDKGRGMSDVSRCLGDGYSTGGTAGTGLGAVRRLSAEFDIHSVPGQGTVVMSRVGPGAAARFGAISLAVSGETECGDGWALAENSDFMSLMLVDGLGHGALAAAAAECAQRAFAEAPDDTPQTLLQRAHRALTGTRGAAAAVARLGANGSLSYAGVGNITGYLVGQQQSQGLVSHNGTLGLTVPRLQQFEYARSEHSCLVMHSDGLSARWDLRKDEVLRQRHPAVIAAVLYRDHARARDDATVVVLN